jgi:hypothetical protein
LSGVLPSRGRWGEKVPAAGRAVAGGLVQGELAPLDLQGALPAADGAEGAAVGAGLVFPQALGLLLDQAAQGALGKPPGRRGGHLLHGGQVDLQAGALLPEGPPGHDFSPPRRQLIDFPEVLGADLRAASAVLPWTWDKHRANSFAHLITQSTPPCKGRPGLGRSCKRQFPLDPRPARLAQWKEAHVARG